MNSAPAITTQNIAATWAVDPRAPGPNAPPQGRSLFDFLVSDAGDGGEARYAVPFPFSELVARIERELAMTSPSGVKRVLIPLGRSLQRNAATPEHFKFPRAVLAVDGEPAAHARMVLKDRLYLGYQEKADIIEVISYNEAAARFEFQLVKDYRADGTRAVVYANRALCMTCHQSAGPIFSRPLWDETNANTLIAQRLKQEKKKFYGFPVEPVSDVAYAIDNAGDRANLYSAYQRIWQEGCESSAASPGTNGNDARLCRADILQAALQYRLTGARGFDTASTRYRQHLARLRANWQRRWPLGLAIPDNDIPNRNPFLNAATGAITAQPSPALNALTMERGSDISADIPAQLEPLQLRAPTHVWSHASDLARVVGGVAEFFSERDIDTLNAALATQAAAVQWQSLNCAFAAPNSNAFDIRCGQQAGFNLAARLYLRGETATIDAIVVEWPDGIRWTHVTAHAIRFHRRGDTTRIQFHLRDNANGRAVRDLKGNALTELTLEWDRRARSRGTLTTTTALDSARIERALGQMALPTQQGASDALALRPFRRAAIMPGLLRALGAPDTASWCCLDATKLPVLQVELPQPEQATANADIALLQQYCARCHDTQESFPPNFMHGAPPQLDAQIAHCADRILFRLSMWEQPSDVRTKTPMPPAHALAGMQVTETDWDAQRARLKRYIATRASAPASALVQRPYEDLRACLAPYRQEQHRGER